MGRPKGYTQRVGQQKQGFGKNTQASKVAIEERRTEVIKLTLQGFDPQEIAAQLGYSKNTVWCDIAKMRKAWAEARLESMEAYVDQELAHLNKLKQEAMEVLNEGDKELALKAIDRLIKLSESRAKLLGLNAPVKIEDVTKYSEEELDEQLEAEGVVLELIDTAKAAHTGEAAAS